MKLKTDINSKTGKKFVAIQKEVRRVNEEALALVKSIGAESFRPSGWDVAGGVSSIAFPEGADVPKWMGKSAVDGEYLPKLNYNAGKEFMKKLDALPTVEKQDVNDCVGFKMPEGHWMNIGFNVIEDKTVVLISGFDNFPMEIPDDCTEITITEYNEIAEIVQCGGKRNG